MSEQFKQRLTKRYERDPRWKRLLDVIRRNDRLKENAGALPFNEDEESLIPYVDLDYGLRLCVPNYDGLIEDVSRLTYDEMRHPGYHRTHKRLTQGLYIQHLPARLHEYLRHWPVCQLNQTLRHKPYGALQPIISPSKPFHTISIDFIVALPESSEGLNCVLSITDKDSERITFVARKDTYKARDWAVGLLQQLDVAG